VRIQLVIVSYLFFLAVTVLGFSEIAKGDDFETLDEVIDVSDVWYLNPMQFPVLDRGINVFSGEALRPKTLLMVFDHRVRGSLKDEPFHDFLGFDAGGLKVGIGLRYGLLENVDVGLYRLNGTYESFDTYELDGRWQLRGSRTDGYDLAVRFGFTWFPHKDKDDASGIFGQLLANKTLAHRIRVGCGLLYHSESSGAVKADVDDSHSLAIPALTEFRVSKSLSWVGEVVIPINGYQAQHPLISTSLKIITHRHTFSVLVTNSQYPTADGIVTGSENDFSEAAIGFTITKELGS